jgi:hypothetical protein
MDSGNNLRSRYSALSLVALGALLRLSPHPPNFTPIGATGIFSGWRLRGWGAYLVPLLAMILTDPIRSAFEGHYPAYSAMTVIIYASLMVYVFLGRTLLKPNSRPVRMALVCFLGSLQFFLVTNFFLWVGSELEYPHTFAGLMACYTAALPFFERTVLGDLFYTGVFAVAYQVLAGRRIGAGAPTTPNASV